MAMEKYEYGKIDSPKIALDYAIRDYEIENGKDKSHYGYDIRNKKYLNYLSNTSWNKFCKEMSELHKAQYMDGDGGELKEKKGRYGISPPKMASFGSSSRLIYRLSKDIPNFSFEKLFPTRVGHTANLDGYLEKGKTMYCVEAKCREIYGSHKKIKISTVYEDVYKLIPDLEFDSLEIKYDNEHCKYTFKYKGKELVHFDIKQLICHFLGIAADILENRRSGVVVKFVYLVFNPKKGTMFTKKRDKIFKQYDETIKEIKRFDMKCLFETIMEYQIKNLNLPKVEFSFNFELVDQDNYQEYFH